MKDAFIENCEASGNEIVYTGECMTTDTDYSSQAAQAMGPRVCSELSADRVYRADGTLVPRGLPGAMTENAEDAIARVVQMAEQGTVCAADGSTVTLQADSVYVHADGCKELCFVKQLSAALPAAGIEIKAHSA